ncbi:hypothetical protein [Herpetosiphon llansteffanensis]|uniref:hypothetical protein n=1 Tax=Herpetosiphon llansteffanensis TaxID=2094568 RepID=UPI000D7BD200|nr:hypothetical protein [Herpetosiphon llansteffanensis]
MSYRVPTNNQHLKLQPGEEILWQGQPVQGFKFYPIDLVPLVIGIFWLYFIITKFIIGEHGQQLPTALPIIMFGLFSLHGGYLVFGRFLFSRALRRQTTYMLTNRRALIHMHWLNRDYQHSYDLARLKSVMLDRLPNGQQSIIFDNKRALPPYLFLGVNSGFATFFEGIPNAEALYQQILALQASLRSKQTSG